MKAPLLLVAILFVGSLLPGCANPHFFPTLRPLFPGLDETRVPSKARAALQQAKVDFQLARKGGPPQYARHISTAPSTHSKTYRGNGYMLTIIDGGSRHHVGPRIVVESAITGGPPYTYDEIENLRD